ncbi:MAG: class I tRNA ligase family protein [Candidatus Colwellbacteria bacterium]|nr:class I tRNA ligase family protein [Candidatus Colwellbacteria bacterium]
MYPFAQIESKWAKRWRETSVYEPDLDKAREPFYNLMMFPYPSAEGLHVGNIYAFTGSDIYGRFQRMHGKDVFEPIGLDGFGIHSENYALKQKTHPAKQSKISEERFYKQLDKIGNGFAWNERLETYDPDYYKWTQWIFIQMWKRGLAYKKKSNVNWCPACKTVLADEQVEGGECERCKTLVTKRELEQWFFKITKYAERLLKNLDKIDWPNHIKIAQRNWIGRSEGALLPFSVADSKEKIKIFTTRPDTILGATYLVLAPEHEFIYRMKDRITNWKTVENYIRKSQSKTENERIAESKAKTGVELKGIKAVNPATRKEIPVWVSDYVLVSYGTGAIMAVPAYDERDEEFAQSFKLPRPKAKLVNGEAITKKVGGRRQINYHLRDWLISRQRYWGPPIPMLYCGKCGWQPVPEKNLPVLLPQLKEFRPKKTGQSPLASSPSFYQARCPKCKGPATRETDVSDTFLDSAWYFYRYLDVNNQTSPINKSRAKKWLPVDTYIGGSEHAVLHLLYSRFLAIVLKELKLIDFDEPFTVFKNHGLLIKDGAKMSKSKGNVVVPDEYIDAFGTDTFRMYLMFLGPFQDGGDWRDSGMAGTTRFLNRVWDFFSDIELSADDGVISDWMHASIKKITDDISGLKYNTAISELMVSLRRLESESSVHKKDLEAFLLMLAPFAPFITEELWEKLGNEYSIHKAAWPQYDTDHLIVDEVSLIIQVNGKLRGSLRVKRDLKQENAEKLGLGMERVKSALGDRRVKKIIFIPNRLVNFVTD